MAWAVAADVLTLTGRTVTAADIEKAQAIVEIHCARSDDVPIEALKARDLYWLKLAVAYQTPWMLDNPDIYSRVEVSTLLQDGVEVRDLPDDALTLAPLARRALRRLTWKKSRSVHVRSAFERSARAYPVGGPVIDYEGEQWRRL